MGSCFSGSFSAVRQQQWRHAASRRLGLSRKRPHVFVVRDAHGETLAYVYCEEAAAKLLTRDKARRIAANIAELPELLRRRAGAR